MNAADVRAGEIYKNIKRQALYRVNCMATHSETLEPLVVYQEVNGGKIWVRPLSLFTEKFEHYGAYPKRQRWSTDNV